MMICCGPFRRTKTVAYRNTLKNHPLVRASAVGALLFGRGSHGLGTTYRNSQPNTLAGQLRVSPSPIPQRHVFRLWDHAGVLRLNPHRHGEGQQSSDPRGMGPWASHCPKEPSVEFHQNFIQNLTQLPRTCMFTPPGI